MKNLNINELLSKSDKIAAASFFDEIVSFVKDVKPVLENLNNSIRANVEKMPAAAKKIAKVTEATELATTEIMNVLDNIFPKVDKVTEFLKSDYDNYNNLHDNTLNFLLRISEAIKDKVDLSSLLPDINNVISDIQKKRENQEDKIREEISGILMSITEDATSIMMSLQVQDITSQQLASVKHLLDLIQDRFSHILKRFGETNIQSVLEKTHSGGSENVTEMHRKIAFDDNAIDAYSKDMDRQGIVDDVIGKLEAGTLSDEDLKSEATSDDIDNMFNGEAKDDSSESIDNEEIQEEVSQSDIDDLFAGGDSSDEVTDSNEEVSQGDIDNIFANSNDSEDNEKDSQDTTDEGDTDSNEEVSQGDIDDIFAGSDDSEDDEPVSQDDIDKLFA